MQQKSSVNNDFYDDLAERWYDDDQHAVAILRAESKLKVAYVREVLAKAGMNPSALKPSASSIKVLDVACGAGFISIPLATDGYDVTGIDLSKSSLAIAARHGRHLANLNFAEDDALMLSAEDASYDVVLLLDFLEHVEDPRRAVAEALRVLKPGGVIVIHTFNRTLPARLLAIKALEWLTKDCPEHVHVYHLFLKPSEVRTLLAEGGVKFVDVRGLRPRIVSKAFWRSLATRRMDPGFSFVYSRSLAVGYIGHGVREPL